MNTIFQNFPFSLPMILDGATGTELIKAGMPSGVCPEEWILNHSEILIHLQKQYQNAGSDAVLAPTFGANRIVLSRYHLEDQIEEMNRELVHLSCRATEHTYIVGDLSPTGKYLAPIGDMDADAMIDVYYEQASILDPLVDFFMIETNMDLAATRMAVWGTKKASKKPIFVTLTVTENGKTMSGDTPEAAFVTLASMGIHAFGLNCSTGPREMKSLLAPLAPLSYALGIPLIAKPNAGAPAADGTHTHLDAEEFASVCREMAALGIPILGGCCGTDPSHIAAIKKALAGIALPEIQPSIAVEKLASNARTIAKIPDELPLPIACDEDFQDDAEEMAEDYGFIYARVEQDEDVQMILELAPFLTAPFAVCGNGAAIAKLQTYFCGTIIVREEIS